MSWAAHELESYILHGHTKTKVSYLAILLGCFLPDMGTKGTVYGFSIFGYSFKPEHAWDYHRGWPGVGFTHTPMWGVVLALLVLWLFKSREWALGLLIGQWAHALTDCFDSVGVMLFFPFTTQHYSTGMWAYAAQEGRYGDAAAYYGSLGLAWDLFWLAMLLLNWRTLRPSYFFDKVYPADPAWGWMRRRLRMSDRFLVALYHAYFLYGACRIFAWTIWAQTSEDAPMDWTWGGPYWVDKATVDHPSALEFASNTLLGLTGLLVLCWVTWLAVGRRLWWRTPPFTQVEVVGVPAVEAGLPGDGAGPDGGADQDGGAGVEGVVPLAAGEAPGAKAQSAT
ncbi:hypothetical protein AQ490_12415 [Wenjunlia vitaminophila]|uniref:Metal-dependent hydrolase n=1 Tax=Wenjunlia vitaminophila TaxID=76728 RepID=A0A0T6LKT1_WENVI|nr:metal-dependent hydrolase [Wenjunlia vitaminophila]KRV46666.1 hypothetical protein AQ490_12415 [Wenjunlia vitaminophila]